MTADIAFSYILPVNDIDFDLLVLIGYHTGMNACSIHRPAGKFDGRILCCVILWLLTGGTVFAGPPIQEPHFAQGLMSGEVTATEVLLQTRLTELPGPQLDADGELGGYRGAVKWEWWPADTQDPLDESKTQSEWLPALPENDFIVRLRLENLQPHTRYQFRALGRGQAEAGTERYGITIGPVGSFQTLPEPDSSESISFCMGSCMNYHAFISGQPNGNGPVTATEEDRALGYPVFAAMLNKKPDFFIGTGDIVYYDHPYSERVETIEGLQRKWHQQFRFPRLIQFFQTTPAYWSKDDHDYRFNDADRQGDRQPGPELGKQIFRQQLPLFDADDQQSPNYRTHRINQDLQLWFLEGRDYRSPNRMEDGPEKTLWGTQQYRWLTSTLESSDATWKILISPTPIVGPDRASKRDNHTNPRGFRAERERFLNWLQQHGQQRVLVFCGDRHWQYHSIDPSGLEEFGCGALNDENAISGVRPGAKGSTDPDGTIQQKYLYPEPTGGFLWVTAQRTNQRPTLTIRLMDDQGQAGYEIQKVLAEE